MLRGGHVTRKDPLFAFCNTLWCWFRGRHRHLSRPRNDWIRARIRLPYHPVGLLLRLIAQLVAGLLCREFRNRIRCLCNERIDVRVRIAT